MRYICLLLSIILCTSSISFGQVSQPYQSEWKKIDSLFDRGLPQSAMKLAEAVYTKAKEKGQQVQMLKAQMYLVRADLQTKEDGFVEAIKRAESEMQTTAFPNNAVWQSIAAQLYWSYYNQNRWKILQRTAISAGTTVEDFEQWDAERFYSKIGGLYTASLLRAGELKNINIATYDPVLTKGNNSRHLRPTLYDLLAFRALAFFENDEKDITQPAFRFEMDDPAAFSDATDFISHTFKTQDTASLQWQALKIYQQLLSLHINDANPDAFVDADLNRLEFVYRASTLADKKELYIKALEQIAQKYSSNPLSALAAYRVAQAIMTTETTATLDIEGRYSRPRPSVNNYPEIKQRLEKIIAKFPKSEGGVLASHLLATIERKELSVQSEQVILPREASKAVIMYRNTPKVWLRLVPVGIEEYRSAFRRGDNKWREVLLKTKPIKAWSENLPATGDYNSHITEVKIDALPLGLYALIASTDEKFSTEQNIITSTIFQASHLSLVNESSGGFVLDRKTGEPISGATVELYEESYKNGHYELIIAQTVRSGNDGIFSLSRNDGRYSGFSVKKGEDVLYLNEGLYQYREQQEQEPQTRTFFFTDRSIYRPGQTIYFKGIMVRGEKAGRENNVVPNQETEVIFYDVNGQKISSQKLTTNEFGSVTGSFVAPEGVLTGNMQISNNSGATHFSVEEYKRPKFAVSFDTIAKGYALGEKITVAGKALAYAGNTIDNATAKYRVVRQARWPYWWSHYYWGMPVSNEMEITRGVAQTDKDGSFTISFTAIPDKAVDPKSLPVFNYTVYADVTDINGETRSGTQSVSVGYTSIVLSANVPEKARPADLDTIVVTSQNLNGGFVPATVIIRIDKLQQPLAPLRKRLWAMPDQFLMDSLTFKQFFPLDEYKNESEPMNWPRGKRVAERTITTTKEGRVVLPISTWDENGWYVIELEMTDNSGKKITERKFVQVWDKNNQGAVSDALAVIPQEQKAQPGQAVEVHAVSGCEKANIIRQVQRPETKTATTQLDYGKPIEWKTTITESDRGGIHMVYVMVKENRVYKQDAIINVPYSNKELNISWETHRDKLLPGAKESWTMVVRGSKKEKLAAEMVAALYDASLDAFRPHAWNMYGLYPPSSSSLFWNTPGFGAGGEMQLAHINDPRLSSYDKRYDELDIPGFEGRIRMYRQRGGMVYDAVATAAAPEALQSARGKAATGNAVQFTPPRVPMDGADMAAEKEEGAAAAKEVAPPTAQNITLRKDFRETAFFFPQLKTDAEGNVRIDFTLPEALTEWKLMTLAHTKDMSFGMLDGKVKTQKDLMVMPGLPRFLRQGDDIIISTKVSNLSDKALTGTATLQILDAQTLRPLSLPFRLQEVTKSFTAAAGQSASVNWTVHVPESLYEPVILRITASAGDFTDGEENLLPILTNRMLVTETLPLWINGNGEKNFSFDKLRHSDSSKTLSHYKLALEYTGNPAWYAVQALPYLMEYPYECAEQVFNRYYATALAAHIVKSNPKIEEVFKSWKELDTTALMSNLEKNQELKSALLEETPWVMEAKNESEQKRRIALLFEAHKLARSLDASINKLEDMLLPEGGFPWFKGMRPDRFITQYIVTGIGRLKQLGVSDNKATQRILDRALPYLDKQLAEDYSLLQKQKVKLADQNIFNHHVQYLYMRSFFSAAIPAGTKTAFDYYKQQAVKYWPKFSPYLKGMTALALHRYKDQQTPSSILASLRETAITKEEMGMYWVPVGYSYWWYEAPIETQSLLIEAFTEIDKGSADIDRMKVWLLKQKQTQNWHSTKATADACYALLLSGSNWLTNEPVVTIRLGDETLRSTELNTQKGTGYFKTTWTGSDVKPNMGDINLSVQNNSNSTSWGAVYWQYFEDMDKITSAATPLVVKKQLFIERNSDRGLQLEPITAQNALKVGDKVKARIEIIVDRDMEYVHMKDMRAAAFEPVDVISGYKWQGGLGYYEATKDASTNFFFNYLRRGKYVFEYPMFVTNKGDFSNGITTIQCMYAPEFSSHTEGIRVKVE